MKKLENLTWKMTGELPEHIENKLDEKDKIPNLISIKKVLY